MAKTKRQNHTSMELNQMRSKGVAAGMVNHPCFTERTINAKHRIKPVRKMKHKHTAFGD